MLLQGDGGIVDTSYIWEMRERVNESSLFFIAESVKKKGNQTLSKREVYEQKSEEYLLPIVEEYGFELIDVEYVKEGSTWYLRAYIDKPGGITLEDCEAVSRRFSEILDTEDYIDETYIMEVSSPGLGRPLKKEKDLKRSIGEKVEIRTYRMIDKQKEFTGVLREYDEDTITIVFDDDTLKAFARTEIALIRLAFDF